MVPGLGTLVNVATVLARRRASACSWATGCPTRTRDVVTDALGLVTLLIAGTSAIAVLSPDLSDVVGDSAPMLIVLGSLLVGGIVGSLLRLEARIEGLGGWLQRRLSGETGLRGAAPVRRGLRGLVPGLLHRPAHHPRLAQRRPRQRRRPAPPQGHARRLRGDRVRGVVRLGGGRQRGHHHRRPGQPHARRRGCSATSCPTRTWRPSPPSAGCCSSGVALRLLRIREIPVADLLPALALAPVLVE